MSGVGRVWGFLRDGFAGSQVGHRAAHAAVPNSGRKDSAASIGVTMPPLIGVVLQ